MEQKKVFVGGLPRSGVSADHLRMHFARYGEVLDAVVMTNPENGVGRGFGFVEFADEDAVLRALDAGERENHVFNNRRVDVKRAQKRQAQTSYATYPNADSKKIFVGGLGEDVTKHDLIIFFQKFGIITDAVVMYERETRRPRGFGFITFDTHEAAHNVLVNRFHELKGITVETKMAEPRPRESSSSSQQHMSMMSPAPATGMYSPHNWPYIPYYYNGSYLVPAYPYPYPYQEYSNHN